jgi:hypothetical protein
MMLLDYPSESCTNEQQAYTEEKATKTEITSDNISTYEMGRSRSSVHNENVYQNFREHDPMNLD